VRTPLSFLQPTHRSRRLGRPVLLVRLQLAHFCPLGTGINVNPGVNSAPTGKHLCHRPVFFALRSARPLLRPLSTAAFVASFRSLHSCISFRSLHSSRSLHSCIRSFVRSFVRSLARVFSRSRIQSLAGSKLARSLGLIHLPVGTVAHEFARLFRPSARALLHSSLLTRAAR